MESPFPGMDPYLEAPSLWPDVHNSLIFATARYGLRIDYRQPPPPPDLSAGGAAWVAQITAPPPQTPTA